MLILLNLYNKLIFGKETKRILMNDSIFADNASVNDL